MLQITTSPPSKVCFVLSSLWLHACSTQAEPAFDEPSQQLSEVEEKVVAEPTSNSEEPEASQPKAEPKKKQKSVAPTPPPPPPSYQLAEPYSNRRVLTEQRKKIQVQQKKVEKIGVELDRLRMQLLQKKLKKYRRIALAKGWKIDVEPSSDKALWKAWVKLEKQNREGVK